MSSLKLKAQEIYGKKDQIGFDQTLRMLSEIINLKNDTKDRQEAIKFVGLLGDRYSSIKHDCFEVLENVLITENDTDLKCEAANSLGRIKIPASIEPLKWLYNQKNNDFQTKEALLRAIARVQFEEEEIQLFIEELDSKYISIKTFVRNQLLKVPPGRITQTLINSLNKERSDTLKIEIIKLIAEEIKALDISFADQSYLKVKYPEILHNLVDNKHKLLELIPLLNEQDEILESSFLRILRLIPNHIKEDLYRYIEEDEFIAKKNSLYLVGKLKLNDGINYLLENVDNIYSEISIAAIEALGEFDDLTIIPQLLRILNIEEVEYEYIDLDMKWYIIETIKRIYFSNPKPSYKFLYDNLYSSNDILKETVVHIMGELGKEEFIGPLLDLLNLEEHIDVSKNIVIALGKIARIESIPPLIELLEKDSTYWLIKKVLVDSLINIFQRKWHLTQKNDSEEKRLLIRSMQRLTDYLVKRPDECFKVKVSIIKLLEKFGGKAEIHALIKRLYDFNRIVGITARNAIDTIEKRLEEDKQN